MKDSREIQHINKDMDITTTYVQQTLYHKHRNEHKSLWQSLTEISCETSIPIIEVFSYLSNDMRMMILHEVEYQSNNKNVNL